jgi:UDP-N-acetylglucosamine:LPS N-acetylglucosamine transferase
MILADGDLMESLSQTILDLIRDQSKLASMRAAMLRLAHPDAAERIADIIENTAMEDRSRA